jgi:excinuclease UvrABC helicase subunit UvrB
MLSKKQGVIVKKLEKFCGKKEVKRGGRVIATTLTKKMAEDLAQYLKD